MKAPPTGAASTDGSGHDEHPRLGALFRRLLSGRAPIVVVVLYALVALPSILFALRVKQDNAPDRLIVQTDPDYVVDKQFEAVFGAGEYAVLLAEADDPFAPGVVARVDALERALAAVPHVEPSSIVSIYRRVHPAFTGSPDEIAALRAFASGTDLFRKQGLVSDRALALPLLLDVHTTAERGAVLAAVDRVLAPVEKSPAPLVALRKIGAPYVNAYLDAETQKANLRYIPLFLFLVVVLNLALYRSLRALVAFLVALGVSVVLTVAFVGATGGVFTIVSSLVPMTILITATATLVYLHSRYVERPPGRSPEEHQVFALANKFLPCTASVFATAVGFAALAVSKIRPIREMGIWVAVGLLFTWVVVFTLFPALVRLLRCPTRETVLTVDGEPEAHDAFARLVESLPRFTYTFRWLLVPGSLLLCAVGAVALFGLPGLVSPMHLETNTLEYINHESTLYQDTKRLQSQISGLSIAEVWLVAEGQGAAGAVTDAQVIAGLADFQRALEEEKGAGIGTVVGLPTLVRTLLYVGGQGDRLPTDPAALEQLSDTLDTLVTSQPEVGRFVDKTLTQTHLAIITRTDGFEAFKRLDAVVAARWKEAVARHPALARFAIAGERAQTGSDGTLDPKAERFPHLTGLAPLQAKISHHLVPTLTESFGLSAVIIFGAFLLVFRSGPARLMAMIPSLFAILVMFAVMRALHLTLNVATILIASTVLGTSENDQIHFFYHFLEKRQAGAGGSPEASLRHALLVAGRAILFATIINAGGFLAFGLADLPPIRQFGILSATAFVLSMIADFTALPAALWLVFRAKPDEVRKTDAAAGTPDPGA